MVHEYAVNPILCTDWRDLRYLVSSFGREEGRLISDVPRKEWQRLTYDVINKSNPKPVMKKRLKLFVRKLIRKALYTRNQTVNSNREWLSNAIDTHAIWPFRAILTDEYSGDEPYILCNNLDLITHSCWCVSISVTIKREVNEMVNAIKPLLEIAREIMLIDRNFRLVDRNSHPTLRYKSVLLEILETVSNKEFGPPVKKLTYHVGGKYFTKEELERQCDLYIKDSLPRGIRLEFVFWPWDKLHDRFVLTEIGGVDFGQGLDECTGYGPEEVKVSRISNADHQRWWKSCKEKAPTLIIS